jgi:PKD repeat protein
MTTRLEPSGTVAWRSVRLLGRALLWILGLIALPTQADAQTSPPPLAYRISYYFLQDCESGCYVDWYSNLVTPWATIGGDDVFQPSWSPDRAWIATTTGYDIVLYSPTGDTAIQITHATTDWFSAPAWSPDGQQIAFIHGVPGGAELGLMRPDGSGVRALTDAASGLRLGNNQPTWSPDSLRIAFTCRFASDNSFHICVVNRDGTGLVRLTSDPSTDSSPVWSPDGTRIAFSTDRFGGGSVLALMNADGSAVSPIGGSIPGWPGSWSSDGAKIAFTTFGGEQQLCGGWTPGGGGPFCVPYYPSALAATTPEGVVTPLPGESDPAWMPGRGPVAAFTSTCQGSACILDGSGSRDLDGTITAYAWDFGDGLTGAGVNATHTYAAGRSYRATLTVTDSAGFIGTRSGTVNVNSPPIALFTFACNLLTCSFDGSPSHDPDGTIASYTWYFGDWGTASEAHVNHAYNEGGTYSVMLSVTDNAGATGVRDQWLTVVPPPFHIGDLDRASTTQGSTWTATVTITVHDSSHVAIANAVVSGSWSGGSSASCTTSAFGRCAVVMSGIPNKTASVGFTVTSVTLVPFVYKPADNHDPDGESNGTTITILR